MGKHRECGGTVSRTDEDSAIDANLDGHAGVFNLGRDHAGLLVGGRLDSHRTPRTCRCTREAIVRCRLVSAKSKLNFPGFDSVVSTNNDAGSIRREFHSVVRQMHTQRESPMR
jgi:hypothetical protein